MNFYRNLIRNYLKNKKLYKNKEFIKKRKN